MKRLVAILLTIAMVAALAVGVSAAKETYTPDASAIAVSDEAGFLAMDPAGSYYLAADLTLTSTYAGTFAGTFDGNGKTLTVSAPVFATVNGATVKNLNVKGAITTTEKTAYVNSNDHDFMAAVAVLTSGASTFTNITSDVDISATGGNTRGAGIVAYTDVDGTITMTDCVNYGDIFMHYSGGVYGWTDKAVDATFVNCVNYGKIGSTTGYVGGVVNRVSTKTSTNSFIGCENHGEVSGTTQIAGIVAYASGNLSFENCLNTGVITCVPDTNTHAGGILGTNQANAGTTTFVKNCVNTGAITGHAATDNEHTAGGICGYINETTLIMERCLNTGDVTGTFAVAGLAGRVRHKAAGTVEPNTQAAFRYCINTGNIVGERSAAGISARCGLTGGLGVIEFTYCINTGNVTIANLVEANATNSDCGIGGIAGHVRAKESENSKVVLNNCITTGDITAAAGTTRIPAFLVGFAGGGANIEFNNNKVSGKLVNENDAANVAGLFNNNSYYLAEGALNSTLVTSDYSYPASREKLEGAEAADFVAVGTKYTVGSFDPATLTNGEAIYAINEAYKAAGATEDVFFMTIDGTFKPTTVSTGENSVLKVDGGYANKLPEAPDTTEPAPDTTEPGSSSNTGDTSVIFIALVIISVATLTVVSKRREN